MTLLHIAKYGNMPVLTINIWCTAADYVILTIFQKHSRTRPSKYKAPQRAQAAQQQQQVQTEPGNVVDGNHPKNCGTRTGWHLLCGSCCGSQYTKEGNLEKSTLAPATVGAGVHTVQILTVSHLQDHICSRLSHTEALTPAKKTCPRALSFKGGCTPLLCVCLGAFLAADAQK
jgi:hypothetical protein